MAKENENQQRNKTRKKRIHLKFELYGLICIAISIIAVLQLGVAGQTFIYMFRFFAGEWFILCFLGLFNGCVFILEEENTQFFNKEKSGPLLHHRKHAASFPCPAVSAFDRKGNRSVSERNPKYVGAVSDGCKRRDRIT